MASATGHETIHTEDIYHGLPDLSNAPTGLTAVVTGANGISGAHMLRVLCQNPSRWKKIFAISRRPPSETWPDHVELIPLDLLSSPEDIAVRLADRGVKPDYIFWFAYILVTDQSGALQWSDRRLIDQNSKDSLSPLGNFPVQAFATRELTDKHAIPALVLHNFLEALPRAKALPKRIFIQYGQKWYGVHLGMTAVPDTEDTPRLAPEVGGLYYSQHDTLTAFCAKNNVHWNAGLPSFVVGASLDSNQSLLYPILMYAAVQKYKGRRLEYPGGAQAWFAPLSLSNAVLDARMYEWMVLSPEAADQMFNVSDACAFTWGKFWPRLAEWFGMEYTGPQFDRDAVYTEKNMPVDRAPNGISGESKMRFRFSFVDWANDVQNLRAWEELAIEHELRDRQWRDVGSIFGRADFALLRPYASNMSTSKARKYGWHGFVDSTDSLLSVAEEFVRLRIIPAPAELGPKL